MSFSVVIPVKDGARYLDEVLAALRDQDEAVEVVVVDSGSTDGSAAIARRAGAVVVEIAPEEFGHGRTRNLGAETVTGDFIAFLTQDATPCPGWLAAWREAFALGDDVGVAYGPHLPRPDTSPMIARELTEFFATFSPDGVPVVQRGPEAPTFLSDVNACYRRACWEELRFDDVPYGEDQAFGKRVLTTRWAKAYEPRARVLHAHDFGPVDFMRRYFDEYRALRATVGHVEGFGLRSSARETRRQATGDLRWMRAQGRPAREIARWAPRVVWHHGGRRVFSALGSRAEHLPAPVQQAISLEGTAVAPPSADEAVMQPPKGPTPFEYVLERARGGVVPLLEPVPGQSERTPLHVAVAIPPFRRGSGGHNSIFQVLTRLEAKGHTVSVWVHDPLRWMAADWPARIRGDLREFFAPLNGPVFKGFEHWYGADVAVATGWETAWPVMGLDQCRARAYLVHDHEPEFYATSAEARWAEETYGFDLFPIAASPWLRVLMLERYGAPATGEFDFGVDHDVYHPRAVERRRDTVVFYSRAVTPRRAVPLGLLALEELHRRRPDVRILLFGDPDPVATPFSYEHLGIASPDALAHAFSEATVGLCLSMTNYSLIPQEMLACGLPCIDLAGYPAETVFGRDGPIELAPFDPLALAAAMERLLDDRALWDRRSTAGLSFVRGRTWDHAADQVEAGLREALRRREEGAAEVRAPETEGDARPWARSSTRYARAVPLDRSVGHDASRRLYERLNARDVAEIESHLVGPAKEVYEAADPEERMMLALHYGTFCEVPAVLEKTDLRPDEPPEDVHSMARGPLAAGGALYYADVIADVYARTGRSLESSVRRALDFGCSSGRLVRAMAAAYPDSEWHGSDPNRAAIAWAREHLGDLATFHDGPLEPPLPFDDGAFDLVVAISIWSHFDEEPAAAWLAEMHRVVRRGGLLVLTVHGPQAIAFAEAHRVRPARQLAEIREALYRRGFWFADEFGAAGDHGVRHPGWGTAFMSPEWLARVACPAWAIEDWAVGQNDDNQDVVVLARR